jgi:hypothetical protein
MILMLMRRQRKAERITCDIKILRIASLSSNLEVYIPVILEANRRSLEILWIEHSEDCKCGGAFDRKELPHDQSHCAYNY